LFLHPSGRMPMALDSDAFRPPAPGWEQNRRGAKAVSTPGNLNAWESMWGRYGDRSWPELLAPAVRLAREGFVISERTARLIAAAWEDFPGHARTFYGTGGRPLEPGERLIQADLARSLQMVAEEGAAALHGGPLGEAVDRTMRETGGFLRLEDLEANEAEWYPTLSIEYRGHRVVTAPPPANSFPALVRLGMMSRFEPQTLGHNSTAYLHRYAEVTKHAFWTRLRYAADPEVRPVPLDTLLSTAYWEDQFARIDPSRAHPFEPPGWVPPETHTTHFVVADRWGNIVSATQTLGNSFGSRIMPEGTGIWLNNSLAYCTFEPAGNPMDAFPGRHKLSGDVPVIIFDEDRPWAALGTPGGHTIAQTVPQMVMNLVDFDMDIQQAIAAPRISFYEPDLLAVEEGVPEEVREALAQMGHRVRPTGGLGNAHGLTITWDEAGRPVRFEGAADPRGSGKAAGWD
ncbi:MAG: gamma-glutamyltransferase, partial [bacterium]